ncbi:MAG: dihydrofolate reductase [Nanoarchaeota archaeon]|nr:dihydrofolate reductase [Nanoarchaeota archaeon]
MDLIMVVAASDNDVIGIRDEKGFRIPWRIKEDVEHFVGLRTGKPIIMGRSTYLSIPERFRPLKGSKNIILSSSMEPSEGICVARDIPEALELANGQDTILGGGEVVYREFLPLITKIELTRVHGIYEGNVYLPEINWDDWNLIENGRIAREEDVPRLLSKDGISYSFLSYARK